MNDRLLATDEQLTGEVAGLLYGDATSGFGVIELSCDDDVVRCVGPLGDLVEGQTVRLVGRWGRHPKYGPTFTATYYEQAAPASLAGLRTYLGSERFAPVGEQAVGRVLSTFGVDAPRVIEHEPQRLTTEAGVSAKQSEELQQAWLEGQALGRLVRRLEPAGWPMDAVRSVHRRFRADAVRVAQEDPYTLLEAERVRFAHVDRLAALLGVDPHDPSRLAAGARAAVLAAVRRSGHQHLRWDECVAAAARLLSVDRLLATEGVEGAIASGGLASEEIDGVRTVSTPQAYALEQGLADDVLRLLDTSRSRVAVHAQGLEPVPELTTGQSAAVRAAFTHPVSVLVGGPGTGKTRTIEEIVRAAERADLAVALCAPTGRAAKRIEELVDRPATTVHRLLESRPKSGGGFAFRYGAHERLPHDLVVVDEVSMCDTWLSRHLVAAVDDGAHLVLVGDPDQLPSVGAGDVLRDLVRCGRVPVTELHEIHRQAAGSRIVGLAREILGGRVAPLKGVDGDVFMAEEHREAVVERVVRAVSRRIPEYFGVDVDDVQVLAPMYRGPAGVDALNVALKAALNPRGDEPALAGFHVGDRVMQTRNDPELDVANGDVGRVVDVSRRERRLQVGFPRGEVSYTVEQARDLVPGWAVTVHKAQGGEWPVVVLVCDPSHRSMLWRNLVYTAVTRAQRALIVVGRAEALRAAAEHDLPSERLTGLAWRLDAAQRETT